MKQNHTSLLFFLFFSFAFSQNKVTVSGNIVDTNSKESVESATVYLTKVKDSSVVDYTISDKLGTFSMTIKKISEPVFLKVSYLTYDDYKLKLQKLEEDKNIGTIEMKEAVTNLDEVVIKKEAPPIRIKKDTLEFNVSSFKVRPDANVETLLKQLPGVEIDNDGKITVNGKEVNQILVNGKPFFDKDGKIALQNLPSNIINKVQVTDTKTKKEEKTGEIASSNNASINLTIDEDKNKGFFGKFLAGYGSDKRYESSALVNYFKNKTKLSVLASSNNINSIGFSMDEVFDNMGGGRNRNVWINGNGSFGINGRTFGGNKGITRSNLVGINYSDQWSKNTETSGSYFYSSANSENINNTNTINFLPTGTFYTASNSKTNSDSFVHNLTTWFEFKIDSTSSITLEPNFTTSKSKNRNISFQSSSDESKLLLNESNSDNLTDNNSNSFNNTLSYTKSFKRKGRYFSVVFENENRNDDTDDVLISNTIFHQGSNPDDIRNQKNNTKSRINNYSTEIEYSEPITDSLKIKIGLDSNFNSERNIRNSFDYDNVAQTYSIENTLISNEFKSLEKTFTPRTGISFNKKKFNFDINLGTSIMSLDDSSIYQNLDTNINRNFILPYLRAYGSIKFSKSKNIWVNYNYNTSFPSASQLLPIEDLADPLNTYIGNPNLELNKYHGVYFSYRDFDYSTRSGYGFYSGGNFYDSQVVSSVTFDEDRKRATNFQNVSGTFNSWFGIYWNKTIKKDANKYRLELRLNNNYGVTKGFSDSELYNANTYSLSPRINFSYDYGELLTVNPSYNYSWNKTNYTNYVIDQASNFTHKFNIQVTNYWPKNFTFGNDFGYNYNSNIANGFKKDFYLWNTSLSYSFFQKKLMAKVKVYDVLNQNQSATRSITATSIQDEENIVLKRYIMFSLSYKIEKFGGKEKKGNGMMWY